MNEKNRKQFMPTLTVDHRVSAWALFSVVLFALLWLSHCNAFDAPFYFDTVTHLAEKTNLQMVEATGQSISDAIRINFGEGISRPISLLSLAFTHLAAGLNPSAYRIGNLLIHWFSTLALAFLFVSAARTPKVRKTWPNFDENKIYLIAFFAASLWSLHPIQTNVVTYVIQRMASLCGLFSFVCMAAYMRCRCSPSGLSWRWFVIFLAAFMLAMASKENAVVLLPLTAACEFMLFETPRPQAVRRMLLLAGGLVAVGVAVLLYGHWKWFLNLFDYHRTNFTMGQRLLTQARLQGVYLRLLLIPDPRLLSFSPEIALSKSLFRPLATFPALLGVVGAVAAAIALRKKWPLLCFGIVWFFIAQLVEGTILPIELYYEHRMYVPSIFIYFFLAFAFFSAFEKLSGKKLLIVLVAALFLVGEAWATKTRNNVWSDPIAFWSDIIAKSPGSARAYTNMGHELIKEKRYPQAKAALTKALELENNKTWIIQILLARIAYREGKIEEAKQRLLRSMELVTLTNWEAPQRLGMLAIQAGEYNEAEKYLNLSLEQRPAKAETWRLLGLIYLMRDDLKQARTALEKALRYSPTNAENWNTLGSFFNKTGNYADAEAAFAKAVSLNSGNDIYRRNLVGIRQRLKLAEIK